MLRHGDGFDHYGDDETLLLQGPYAQASNVTLVNTPRTGTRALKLQSAVGVLRRVFGEPLDEFGLGFAFNVASLPLESDALSFAQFRDDNNWGVVTLLMSSTGQIVAMRGGNGGTEIGRSSPVVLTGSYQHFECNVVSDLVAGAVECRINGVTVLNVTGEDTLTHTGLGGPSTLLPSQWAIGATAGAITGSVDMVIDDLFFRDAQSGSFNNTFVGDKKVYTVFPTADTAVEDWVPSSGVDSYQMVNNNPPVDTDFLSSSTVADETDLELDALPAEVVSIAGVFIVTRMWKSDAGDGSVTPGMVSGATQQDGEEHALSLSPTDYIDVFEVDPNTASPWSVVGFNAAKSAITRTL